MRAREAGIVIGTLPPGPHNAITDVPGVRVGHCTLVEGDGPLLPTQCKRLAQRVGLGIARTGGVGEHYNG